MWRMGWWLSAMVLLLTKDGRALKSVRIRVPELVKSGDTVTLVCDYDLEQVALYTIKWYWKDVEFYRFVPKESPPYRAFTMQHINVDISRSGPTQVTLRGVRRELSGDYKCEVSADGPLFHTDIQLAHMIVAELPTSNPTINLEHSKVEIGKRLHADCYSPGSDPPANLTWYINTEKISEENESTRVLPMEVHTDNALGLHSSHSRIEITTHRAHFLLGLMVVKCEASIYTLWRRTVQDVVRDDSPQLAPVLGSTSSHQTQVDDIFSEGSYNSTSSSGMLSRMPLSMIAVSLMFR